MENKKGGLAKYWGTFTTWFKKLKIWQKVIALIAIFIGFNLLCCAPLALLGTDPEPNVEATVDARLTQIATTLTSTITPTVLLEATNTNTPRPTWTDSPTKTNTVAPTLSANLQKYPCITDANPQTGTVLEVVDGDTIKVLIDGKTYSLRYIGMDTPESTIQHEAFGKEAASKNAELVFGKKVTLYRDQSETDKFDRLLRYVFVDDLFINAELVKLGFAEAKDYPPDTACSSTFHSLNTSAQADKLGMWSSSPTSVPVAPIIAVPIPPTDPSGLPTISIISVRKEQEYVVIHNNTTAAIDLKGWNLVSEKGPQDCPLGGVIQPGADLTIYAMTGTDGYNCNYGGNIWNNDDPDPAVLYDPQGNEIDRK